MQIKLYPVFSSLHQKNAIQAESQTLMQYIKEALQVNIGYSTLEQLYQDAALSCVFIQSGGSEQEFLKIYPHLQSPIYLLTTGFNNSLAASMEILSFLKSQNVEAEIIHGSFKEITEQIKTMINFKKIRLGVVGKPSDWLIASQVDYQKVQKQFKIELVDIAIEELIELVHTMANSQIDLNAYSFPTFDSNQLTDAMKVYQALKQIIQKYQLQGLTVRCFDLLKPLKTTSCLAFALLNQEGIIATCEGDIPSMLSMYILKTVTQQIGFQANPCQIKKDQKQITFAHCTIPLNMVKPYSFMTHFESNIGVAIQGKLKKSTVTLFKLSNDLQHFFVAKGKIIQNLSEKNLCRTQIVVQLQNNIDYFFKNPYGNHHILVYGNYTSRIKKYMKKSRN